VLADVLLNPCFDPAAFQAEKLVILEEMARRADMRQIIWDLYDLTLWQAHPLRHRVLGYESAVAALTMDDVAVHYHRFCVPPAAVLVVCGDCDPAEALEEVERLYGRFAGEPPEIEPVPAEPPLSEIRKSTLERATPAVTWVRLRGPQCAVYEFCDQVHAFSAIEAHAQRACVARGAASGEPEGEPEGLDAGVPGDEPAGAIEPEGLREGEYSRPVLERLLAELVNLRLMLRDDGHYLSLAICTHGESGQVARNGP